MTLDEFEKEIKGGRVWLTDSPNCKRYKRQQLITNIIEIVKATKVECGRVRCLGYPNPVLEKLVDEVCGEVSVH